jgi:hypothetical protein
MFTKAETGEKPNDLTFLPLLRKQAYQRALNMKMNKEIEIQVTNPHQISKEFLDQNDWLAGSVNQAKELNSDKMTISYALEGRPKTGMPSQKISQMIRGVQELLGLDTNVVEKLTVTGYYYDPDDDKLFKDAVDFILDKYQKSFRIELPNVASDPRTAQKGEAIYKLYINCHSELKELEAYKA